MRVRRHRTKRQKDSRDLGFQDGTHENDPTFHPPRHHACRISSHRSGPLGPSNILVLPRGGVRFSKPSMVKQIHHLGSPSMLFHPSIHVSDTIDLIVGLYLSVQLGACLFIGKRFYDLPRSFTVKCFLCWNYSWKYSQWWWRGLFFLNPSDFSKTKNKKGNFFL